MIFAPPPVPIAPVPDPSLEGIPNPVQATPLASEADAELGEGQPA